MPRRRERFPAAGLGICFRRAIGSEDNTRIVQLNNYNSSTVRGIHPGSCYDAANSKMPSLLGFVYPYFSVRLILSDACPRLR